MESFSTLNALATRKQVVDATCITPGCQYQWTPYGKCTDTDGDYTRERTLVSWLEPGGSSPPCPTASQSISCSLGDNDSPCVCQPVQSVPWGSCRLTDSGAVIQERRCVPQSPPVGHSAGQCVTPKQVSWLLSLWFIRSCYCTRKHSLLTYKFDTFCCGGWIDLSSCPINTSMCTQFRRNAGTACGSGDLGVHVALINSRLAAQSSFRTEHPKVTQRVPALHRQRLAGRNRADA